MYLPSAILKTVKEEEQKMFDKKMYNAMYEDYLNDDSEENFAEWLEANILDEEDEKVFRAMVEFARQNEE